MKRRRLSMTLALAATATASIVVLSPSTAQAVPTNCSYGLYNATSSYATCSAGSGQFRAKAKCDLPWQIDEVYYGHWLSVTNPPSNSFAICPLDARKAYNIGIETK